MDVVLLNVKIVFQKNEVVVDAIGNHQNQWVDYYACHAKRGGGRVSAKPHIAAAEQAGIEQLEKEIQKALEG